MSTIKDVAKMAGVSVSTVSRTLSGKTFVEKETKERVLNAVKALDYRPNIIARGLRAGKLNVIAFLVPNLNSLFTPEIIRSVEQAAAKKGFVMVLINTDESLEKEKNAFQFLRSSLVSGVLCMCVDDDAPHILEFQEEMNTPVVLINRQMSGKLCSVSCDDEEGAYLVTRYLLERGHKKIAGMFGSFEKRRFRARYNGCKKAMEEFDVQNFKRYFTFDINGVDEASERTMDFLKQEDPPTAFFASYDALTLGIYSGIYQCGFRVPDDISVVGYDNLFLTKYMMPPLTTYRAPIDEIAEQAIRLLIDQIEGNGSVKELILRGAIKERASVAPCKEGDT